ncbi:MAG: TIGR03790 family protein, partial [Verrucomicrobiota bacterium]
ALPLRKILELRGWWKVEEIGTHSMVVESRIRFVALMRGMPLKIAPEPANPADPRPAATSPLETKDEASVDSELAALGSFSPSNYGLLNNPYFRSYTPALDVSMPMLMLVCRLDAPDVQTVRRMIDDAIEAEKTGLYGFAYVDARGLKESALIEGDKWLGNLADSEQKHGIPVIFDNLPAMFPDAYPMDHAALYYGWYSENAAGPFARDDFRFVKGAVACHIHSFSALSIRDPHKFWVAPLLARGVAATMGNVYEPFLGLTPNLDIFDDRLRAGFTFAESAYMSERGVSWMTTFVGDPLYRPFKSALEIGGINAAPAGEWQAYKSGALLWFEKDHPTGASQLQKSGETLHSGMIFEGLGLLQASAGEPGPAFKSFLQAQKYYTGPGDILRILIHEVGFLKAAGRKDAALKLARSGIRTYPNAPATAVLRGFEAEMAPPTPTPSPAPRKL